MLTNLRDRHLELLEHCQEPLHRAEVPAECLYGSGDLPGVECVIDPPMRGQAAPHLRRQLVFGLAGDQGQLDARQPRCCFDESRGRIEQVRCDEGSDHHAW
jgi:hypothetical protein